MDPKLSLIRDGKKFMWDGVVYDTEAAAAQAATSYRQNQFEVAILMEDGKHLVYTRRAVAQVAAAQ